MGSREMVFGCMSERYVVSKGAPVREAILGKPFSRKRRWSVEAGLSRLRFFRYSVSLIAVT